MAKRILRDSVLPAGWSRTAIFVATAYAAGIQPGMAAVDLSAGLTIGAEHDSNALGVSEDQVRALKANGAISKQDDTARRLTANAAATGGVANGPLYLQLNSQYTRVDYANLDTLNHSEYNFGGNVDWKPSQVFDLSLKASQARAPIDLNDVGGIQSVQQTSRQADLTFRLRPTPYWQLSLTPAWYDYKIPLPEPRGFKLRETSGTAQIDYLGVGKLVPGFAVKELRGQYYQVANATRYQTHSAGMALNYKVTNFSSFSLFAGYARRNTRLVEASNDPQALALEGTTSGFTGNLNYQRQLSVKTGISLNAFRAFQQYDVGQNTAIGTGFNGSLIWKATAKLSTTLDGGLVWLTIDTPQIASVPDERKDLERSYSLSLNYLATRRLSLRTYVARHLHNSTVRTGVFNQTVAGVDLSITFD